MRRAGVSEGAGEKGEGMGDSLHKGLTAGCVLLAVISLIAGVRDGNAVTMIGGPIIFRRCSAELEPESRFLISRIAERVRGYRHKIQVTGHTSAAPLPDDSPYPDKLALAHARARAVRDYLVELDVAPERIHIIAVGPYEPVVKHAYSEDNLAENRRVEILICEALVSDYDSTARSGVEAPAGNP